MAKSTSSQQRAQLLRDLSKDSNWTRNSSRSSRQSQRTASPQPTNTTDFDPENEALSSTRQIDNLAQQLPELRATAQKHTPIFKTQRKEEDFAEDYAIDTSAVARAFPDFSQGSSSFDPSPKAESPSIEVGRGVKKSTGKPANGHLDGNEDTFNSDAPFPIGGGYQVMYTPPLRSHHALERDNEHFEDSTKSKARSRKVSSLQREVVDPLSPPSKVKDYGSGESRKGSGEAQRPKPSMQPGVHDEDDLSHLAIPNSKIAARNTRFVNTRSHQSGPRSALPTRFSSAQTLMSSVAPSKQQHQHNATSGNTGTPQTFILPPMPNMNELMSGVFDNGTPVFTRSGKPSRFAQNLQQRGLVRRGHDDIGEIPMREDEQAIFLQLQMLRDRCAQLERKDAETSEEMRDLKNQNRQLQDEKDMRQKQPSRDSALGTSDSESEKGVGQRRLLVEKTRLESTIRKLQIQLDAANRKASTTEAILNEMTKQRDAAVAQLSVAWCTIEQLKVDNEDLKAEIDGLRARGNQIGGNQQTRTQKYASSELDIERLTVQPSGALDNHNPLSRIDADTHKQRHSRDSAEESVREDAGTMFDLSVRQNVSRNAPKAHQRNMDKQDSVLQGDVVIKESRGKEKGRSQAHQSHSTRHVVDETSKNLTYLSFIDSHEIAKLRQTLEQERIERKRREATRSQTVNEKVDPNGTTQKGPEQQQFEITVSRKSSMRNMTTKSALEEYINDPSVHTTGSQAGHNRRHSDTSIMSTRSRRRNMNHENMTSAFIVPDITIRDVPEITKEQQDVLNGLTNHKAQNCTVCQREVKAGEDHSHVGLAKNDVKIPKPIAISDRVLKRAERTDDPTIRPSQAPGLALATVLKGLEDELDHLKITMTEASAVYKGQNPAYDRRQRKAAYERIQRLQQDIEVKSDQIYSLYDVLEGQKEAGQQMSDEEAEETMQSIGLDPADLHLRGGADDHPWDLESTGSSTGLPWEGIESTSRSSIAA